MDDIATNIIELIDKDSLAEAFDLFTSNCGMYQSCEFGQKDHTHCISTCLYPKLQHQKLISAEQKWSERAQKVEMAFDSINQTLPKHFQWTEKYEIGHHKIDEDHRQIIKIINELVDSYVVGDIQLCDRKLNDFKVRLAQHFVDEDIIMAELNFIDPDHEELHESIENSLNKLTGNYKTLAEWRDCVETLLHVFIRLIIKHDFKFASYLEKIDYFRDD